MKTRLALALFCSLSSIDLSAAAAQDSVFESPQQLSTRVQNLTETVIDGLKGPYGLFFDSTDLLVTTETDLIKLKLSEVGHGDNPIKVETLGALAGGSALGLIKHGNNLVVMECTPGCASTRLYIRTPDGEQTTLFETEHEIVEVRAYKNKLLISDITASELLLVDFDGSVSVFSTDKLNGPAGLYIDGNYVWVTNFFNGELLRINDGGQAEIMASGLGMPVGVQYDGKDFIVADFAGGAAGEGRVLRVSKSGGIKVIADGAFIGNPSAIALQGTDIYVSDILSGKIVKINTPRLFPVLCKNTQAPSVALCIPEL